MGPQLAVESVEHSALGLVQETVATESVAEWA